MKKLCMQSAFFSLVETLIKVDYKSKLNELPPSSALPTPTQIIYEHENLFFDKCFQYVWSVFQLSRLYVWLTELTPNCYSLFQLTCPTHCPFFIFPFILIYCSPTKPINSTVSLYVSCVVRFMNNLLATNCWELIHKNLQATALNITITSICAYSFSNRTYSF